MALAGTMPTKPVLGPKSAGGREAQSRKTVLDHLPPSGAELCGRLAPHSPSRAPLTWPHCTGDDPLLQRKQPRCKGFVQRVDGSMGTLGCSQRPCFRSHSNDLFSVLSIYFRESASDTRPEEKQQTHFTDADTEARVGSATHRPNNHHLARPGLEPDGTPQSTPAAIPGSLHPSRPLSSRHLARGRWRRGWAGAPTRGSRGRAAAGECLSKRKLLFRVELCPPKFMSPKLGV